MQKLKNLTPVNIFGASLSPTEEVRNLGVWFDSDFSFSKHIKSTCRLALFKSGISSNSDGISHEMLLL